MNIKPKKPTKTKPAAKVAEIHKNTYDRICRVEVAFTGGELDHNRVLYRGEDVIYRLELIPNDGMKYMFRLHTEISKVELTANGLHLISFKYDNFHVMREITNSGMSEAYIFSFKNCNKYQKIVISFGAPHYLLKV